MERATALTPNPETVENNYMAFCAKRCVGVERRSLRPQIGQLIVDIRYCGAAYLTFLIDFRKLMTSSANSSTGFSPARCTSGENGAS